MIDRRVALHGLANARATVLAFFSDHNFALRGLAKVRAAVLAFFRRHLRKMTIALVLYISVECMRLREHVRLVRRLRGQRTPMHKDFDPEKWGRFFLDALRREAALPDGNERLESMVSSAFWGRPVAKITGEELDAWLLVTITTREYPTDGRPPQWAIALAAEARAIFKPLHAFEYRMKTAPPLEYLLGSDSPVHKSAFCRINHPALGNGPPAPLLRPLPVAALFGLIRVLADISFRTRGYQRHVDEETGFVFWVCRRVWGGDKCLLFLPGLGIGAAPYAPLLWALTDDVALRNTYADLVIIEPPGLSMHPMRDRDDAPAFPAPDEIVDAISRLVRNTLHHERADAIGHSYGGLMLSYIAQHEPSLLDRQVYAETMCFFSHASAGWPLLMAEPSRLKLARLLLGAEFSKLMSFIIISETYTQHVLHSCIWWYQYCNRETTLGERAMILLAGDDHYVDGPMVKRYMDSHHPSTVVHLLPGWVHGSFCSPDRISAVRDMLGDFLAPDRCGGGGGGDTSRSSSRRPSMTVESSSSVGFRSRGSEVVLELLARSGGGV